MRNAAVACLGLFLVFLFGCSRTPKPAPALRAKYTAEENARDVAALSAETKALFDRAHRQQQIGNDELALKNAELENDLAGLEDRPKNYSKTERLKRIIAAEEAAADLDQGPIMDVGSIMDMSEKETLEHNRLHPEFPWADSSDLIERERAFRRDLTAINDAAVEKMRGEKPK